jgi:hypothetical protein
VTKLEIIKRKIQLNRQGITLCKDNIDELQFIGALIKAKPLFEKRISKKFDPNLSAQLDAINFLYKELCGDD